MNRRDFLTKSAATAAVTAIPRALVGSLQTASVTIGAARKLPGIAPDFMGLGYEISSVSRSGLLSARNRVYLQMVRQLGARGVIRVGGNTADYAHFRAQGLTVSSPYGTIVNNAVLADLGTFLKETDWQLIWALNLGSATEDEAVAEARAVMAAAGDRLLAFEIGNEPDVFSHEKHRPPDYTYDAWLAEYRRYKTALRSQLPRIPFAGPDVAGKTEWVTRFADDEGKDVVLLTHHYYREGQSPASTIEKLLGVDPKLQPQLDALRAASSRSGIPYRICEVNSFSGGGRPGVSDTLASALWALDYLFTLASNGCSGVNMETGVNQLGFISSYSPIGDDEHGRYVAKPEYYGLLAFALFGQGALLEVAVEGDSSLMKAYATSTSEKRLLITLINKGAAPSSVRVLTGSHGHGPAHVLRLEGEPAQATAGITLGGAQVSAQGLWRPRQRETLLFKNGQLAVPVPAYSAAMVEVQRS